jgi:MFS family permease
VKSLGGTSLDIGFIDGLANAVAAVMKLPAGRISDRIGRRPLVLVGYGLSAVIRPLVSFATSPLGVLAVRAADRFGKGLRAAPRDALVTDLVEPALRGRAFGHIRAMDHAGAALGPLVATLFLLVLPGRERLLFLLAIVPGLATLAVIWRFVRDPLRRSAAPRPLTREALSRPQAMLLGCVALWALAVSSEQFLLMRASALGVPLALVPLVWFFMSAAKSVAARFAGPLVDRLAPRGVLIAGWLLFAVAYAGLALSDHIALALPLVVVVGLAYGISEPAERALVAALATDGRQGAAFGWYALVQGLMALPAGLLAGWLWQQGPLGPSLAFATTAGLVTVASGLLAVTRRGAV